MRNREVHYESGLPESGTAARDSRSKDTAAQLKEHLRGFLDPVDGITVVEVGEERASRRALADIRAL